MTKLSANFTTTELCVSADFPELAAKIVPTEEQLQRAEVLAQSCLQPLRDEFGPLIVLSWLRSPALNRKVGGSPTTDHILGSAADIYSAKWQHYNIWEFAIGACLPYRQVILYPDDGFVHVSINIPGRETKHEAMIKESSEWYVHAFREGASRIGKFLTLSEAQVERMVKSHKC